MTAIIGEKVKNYSLHFKMPRGHFEHSLDLQRDELVGNETDTSVDARSPPVVRYLIVQLNVVAFLEREFTVGARLKVK